MSHHVYGDYMMNMPANWRPLARLGVKDVAERSKFTSFLKKEEVDVLGVESSRTERIQQEIQAKYPNEGKQMISLLVYAEERRLDALEKEKHEKLKMQLVERREKQLARKLDAIKLPKFVDAQGNSVPIGTASTRAWMMEHNPEAYTKWATLLKEATRAQQSKCYAATRAKQDADLQEMDRKIAERQMHHETIAAEIEKEQQEEREKAAAKHAELQKSRLNKAKTLEVQTHSARVKEAKDTLQRQHEYEAKRDAELREKSLARQQESESVRQAIEQRTAYQELLRERKAEETRTEWETRVQLCLERRSAENATLSESAAKSARLFDDAVSRRREELEMAKKEKASTTLALIAKKDEQLEELIKKREAEQNAFVKSVETRLQAHDERAFQRLLERAADKRKKLLETRERVFYSEQRRAEQLQHTVEHAHALTARRPLPESDRSQTVPFAKARSRSPEKRRAPIPPVDQAPLTERYDRSRHVQRISPLVSERTLSPSSNEQPEDSETTSPPKKLSPTRIEAVDRLLFTYDKLDERSHDLLSARQQKDELAAQRRREVQDRTARDKERNMQWVSRRKNGMTLAQEKQKYFEEKNAKLMEKPKAKHFSPPKSLLLWAPKVKDPYEDRAPLPPLPSAALGAPTRDPFGSAKLVPPIALVPPTSPPVAPTSTGLRTPGTRSAEDRGGLSGTITSTSTTRVNTDAQLREALQRAEANESNAADRRRQEAERAEAKKRAAEERRAAAAASKETEHKRTLQERLRRHEEENAKLSSARLVQAEEALKRNHVMLEASALRKDDFVTERAARIAADQHRRDEAARLHRTDMERAKDEKIASSARRVDAERDRYKMVTDDDPVEAPFSLGTFATHSSDAAVDAARTEDDTMFPY